MEDHIVKSQKTIAVRSALAMVAAGSALALTACGAGQISQTANQTAAVNGANAEVENVQVRDATIVIGKDGNSYLKFTAANTEERGEDLNLRSVTVDGKEVELGGEATAKAGCNLVASTPDEVKELEKGTKNLCTTYISPKLTSTEGIYAGGAQPAKFNFSIGTAEASLPVAAEHTQAGEAYRNPANDVVNSEEFHEEESHGGH